MKYVYIIIEIGIYYFIYIWSENFRQYQHRYVFKLSILYSILLIEMNVIGYTYLFIISRSSSNYVTLVYIYKDLCIHLVFRNAATVTLETKTKCYDFGTLSSSFDAVV